MMKFLDEEEYQAELERLENRAAEIIRVARKIPAGASEVPDHIWKFNPLAIEYRALLCEAWNLRLKEAPSPRPAEG